MERIMDIRGRLEKIFFEGNGVVLNSAKFFFILFFVS